VVETNSQLQNKLKEYDVNITQEEKKIQQNRFTHTSRNGYVLYAFKMKELRFKCGMCRPSDLDNRKVIYKKEHPDGDIQLITKVHFPFVEKIMSFMLKEHTLRLGNDCYDGSLENIKTIFEIVSKLEDIIISDNTLVDILESLNGKYQGITKIKEEVDPEVPQVRKAKRSVEQVNKETGEIIATYSSLVEAGKAIGRSDVAVGVSVRNKSLCNGYILV
jgi:hypothetical protein